MREGRQRGGDARPSSRGDGGSLHSLAWRYASGSGLLVEVVLAAINPQTIFRAAL